MHDLLSCPRGHFWGPDEEGAAAVRRCPECGEPAESLPLLDLAPSGPLPPPPTSPEPPPLLDERGHPCVAGYVIREDLGRGPTGARLYRAEQTATRRDVLLTAVLAREDSSQQAWGALRGEAVALARVNHPCFPVLYETGQRERQVFFNATSACGGLALPTFVSGLKRPLPAPQVLRLMEVLARAVAACHEEGLIHRHLHPGCIALLPAAGGPGAEEASPVCRLGDGHFVPQVRGLGVARGAGDVGPYDVALYGGQPGYLSPEQVWGRSVDLGPATDVYGLGGVLYYLLTGRPPFQGPTLGDVLDAVQTARLLPPGQYRRTPQDLDLIVRKCLARVPGRRYRTALELADDLHRARSHRPLAGATNTTMARVSKWCRRDPGRAVAVVVLALALCGSLLAYRVGRRAAADAAATAARAAQERDRAQGEAARWRAEAEELREAERFGRYGEAVRRAALALDGGDRARAARELEDCDEAERRFEWYALNRRAAGRGPVTLADLESRVQAAEVCASSGRVVLVTGAGRTGRQVRVWRPGARAVGLALDDQGGELVAVRPSPDGRRLAVLCRHDDRNTGSDLMVYDLESGLGGRVARMVYLRRLPKLLLSDLAFDPGGEWLVVTQFSGDMYRFRASDGRSQGGAFGSLRLVGHGASPVRLAYHPYGTAVAAFVPGGTEVTAYSPENGHFRLQIEDTSRTTAIAFGPDGELAVAREDRTITLYRPDSSEPHARVPALPGAARRLAFSPDGRRLAAGCDGGRTVVAGRGLAHWSPLVQLPADGTVGVAFTATGQGLIAAGAKGVSAWGEVESGPRR